MMLAATSLIILNAIGLTKLNDFTNTDIYNYSYKYR